MPTFSSNWFDKLAKPNFDNILKYYQNDSFKYLEIGTYEGASLYYVLNNCKNCEATVIDPFIFKGDQLQIFNDNLK